MPNRYGEQHPEAKLTDELVKQIRTAGDLSNAELARSLGVARTTVQRARIGLTWRHVK